MQRVPGVNIAQTGIFGYIACSVPEIFQTKAPITMKTLKQRYAAVLCTILTMLVSQPALAQTKAALAVVEIDVKNPEAFSREFFPLAAKVFADAGGSFVVRPSQPTAVDDVPPKRVAIIQFESVQRAVDTFASQAYRDARKVGDLYASFRIFVLEMPTP